MRRIGGRGSDSSICLSVCFVNLIPIPIPGHSQLLEWGLVPSTSVMDETNRCEEGWNGRKILH